MRIHESFDMFSFLQNHRWWWRLSWDILVSLVGFDSTMGRTSLIDGDVTSNGRYLLFVWSLAAAFGNLHWDPQGADAEEKLFRIELSFDFWGASLCTCFLRPKTMIVCKRHLWFQRIKTRDFFRFQGSRDPQLLAVARLSVFWDVTLQINCRIIQIILLQSDRTRHRAPPLRIKHLFQISIQI